MEGLTRLVFKESSLGRLFHRVAIPVCLSACQRVCPLPMQFFLGLSLAPRSRDQIPASHWSTPQNCFKDFGGNLFQRFGRKIVSKILEEISFKDFGRKLFQRFWRKHVSKILTFNILFFILFFYFF